MDRAAWGRAGIFATILALLALILITPNLIGRPAVLASLPILIVGLTEDRSAFVVHVGGAVGAYMYANVTLEVFGMNATLVDVAVENDTYSAHLRVPVNEAQPLRIHTYLADRQDHYFEYNVTAAFVSEQGRPVLLLTLVDEEDREERRTPPDDFRWPVPLRGTL